MNWMSAAEVSAQRLGPVMQRGSPPANMLSIESPHSVIDQERSNMTNMFTVLSVALNLTDAQAASGSIGPLPPVEPASGSNPMTEVVPDEPLELVAPEPLLLPPLVAFVPPAPVVPPFPLLPPVPGVAAAPRPKPGPVSTEG